MVKAITERSQSVKPADVQPAADFRVVPIIGRSHTEPDYHLLEDQTVDKVQITETSDAGAVPELVVENSLDAMVFLMDGQELIGAKQNRILNTDVLIAPNSKAHIPVSCVEEGRWRHVSPHFTPGKSASHRTRSSKMRRVRESLEREGRYDADQSAVWGEVQHCMSRSAAASPTSALADAYAAKQRELNAARAALQLPDDAVGVGVFRGEAFLGLDLFDRHATCRYFWESLIDSYLIDPVDGRVAVADAALTETQTIQNHLGRVTDATWRDYPTPGEGRDYRCNDDVVEAAALVWNDEVVVHLQLFPNPAAHDSQSDRGTRVHPRLHRRYMRRRDD